MSRLDNDKIHDLEIGIVGGGSMGSGMTLLFSQHGAKVGTFDTDAKAVEKNLKASEESDEVKTDLVWGFSSLKNMMSAFAEDKPRIVVFSLPHGKPVDGVIDELLPLLKKGDCIIDGGNEWWESTERRQKKAGEKGIYYIGTGVSGGYQAARRGPSMSPGGDKKAYAIIEPYLKKWAAKTPEGEPCVGLVGPGGSGHYVKMLHNGIEQAHLSIICEVRALLHFQLGLTEFQVSDAFEKWTKNGELKGNYLLDIGYKALKFTKGDGIEDERGIVEGIEDKVTQDVDNSEGTGVWTTSEIAVRHVAAPSIAAAHQLRIISADRGERLKVAGNMDLVTPSKAESIKDVDAFVETVREATYCAILASFVQGLGLISRASQEQKWDVSLAECIRIWRAGCIIQSDAIADFLQPLLTKDPKVINLLLLPTVAKELSKHYGSLKKVVALAVECDAVAPALSATLEYIKSVSSKHLPTDFEEAELDWFGHHNYDLKAEFQAGAKKGSHHTEWSPA